MYQVLLLDGKRQPEVIEGEDSVTVVIKRHILKPDIVSFLNRINEAYQLTQKETIFLGLLAQNAALTALEADKLLGLSKQGEIRNWMGKLFDNRIISSRGTTNNTQYYIEPKILQEVRFTLKTNLKKIEPHRLRELVYTDLSDYPGSSINEILNRIGKEIGIKRLKRTIDKMRLEGILIANGENRWTRYSLAQKSPNMEQKG
jgi:ATP-dependent DNA helicase RecG